MLGNPPTRAMRNRRITADVRRAAQTENLWRVTVGLVQLSESQNETTKLILKMLEPFVEGEPANA